MVDRLLIERKLGKIEGYLRELGSIQVRSLDEFKGNVASPDRWLAGLPWTTSDWTSRTAVNAFPFAPRSGERVG